MSLKFKLRGFFEEYHTGNRYRYLPVPNKNLISRYKNNFLTVRNIIGLKSTFFSSDIRKVQYGREKIIISISYF